MLSQNQINSTINNQLQGILLINCNYYIESSWAFNITIMFSQYGDNANTDCKEAYQRGCTVDGVYMN